MSDPKKTTKHEELERISDALTESVLNASGYELRDELAAAGLDPDSCIADVDATFEAARAKSAQTHLNKARDEIVNWRKDKSEARGSNIEEIQAKFERLCSGDKELAERMMLAARKGEGLSDRDKDELLESLAELEELERKKTNE